MRGVPTVAFAAAVSLGLSSTAPAQDIPDAPIPAGPVPVEMPADAPPTVQPGAPEMAPGPTPSPTLAAPAAPPYAAYDQVEVEDPVEPGFWDKCTVIEAFQGAYAVDCNYSRSIRRDIHVRPVGGQPVTQTAARPATGEPWPRGAIILGSPMGLPNDWRLCVIRRNDVAASNSYVATCGASDYRLLPRWIRADPKAPAG